MLFWRRVLPGSIIIALLGLPLVWLIFGRRICLLLDHFFLAGPIALEASPLSMNQDRFAVGSRARLFPREGPGEPKIGEDAGGRIFLAIDGKTFTFGPMTQRWSGSKCTEYAFDPDPGDIVSFTRRPSRLRWPTPFHFNLMGSARSTWRRHVYHRLRWMKPGGQTLEIVWRGQEWHYKKTGWADQYDERVVELRIGR